jgi:hypothetical protein
MESLPTFAALANETNAKMVGERPLCGLYCHSPAQAQRQFLSVAVVSLTLNRFHSANCFEYRFFAWNWHPVKPISSARVVALPILVRLLTKVVFLAVSV